MPCDNCNKLQVKIDALLTVNTEWVKRCEKLENVESLPGSWRDATLEVLELRKRLESWQQEYYFLVETSQGYKRRIKELEAEVDELDTRIGNMT